MAMGFFFLFYFRSLKIGSIFEKYSFPLSPSYTRVLRAYERDGRRVYLERERGRINFTTFSRYPLLDVKRFARNAEQRKCGEQKRRKKVD